MTILYALLVLLVTVLVTTIASLYDFTIYYRHRSNIVIHFTNKTGNITIGMFNHKEVMKWKECSGIDAIHWHLNHFKICFTLLIYALIISYK